MKVHVIGGGPAGLYFAILAKKAWPQMRITVFERNRPDDTFGFGVVFSDETLDTFEIYDHESYRAIVGRFAYWDDIEIHFRGTTHRIGGNGFCGCSRAALLKILGRRARGIAIPRGLAYGMAVAAEALSAVLRRPPVINRDKVRDLSQPCWVCSTEAAKRDLGYSQKIPLEAGLRDTYQWYRKEGWL